jgi:hypothetical protein
MKTIADLPQFNLLSEPPTAADIERAKERLDGALRSFGARSYRRALGWVGAAAGLALLLGFQVGWAPAITLAMLFVGFGVVFAGTPREWASLHEARRCLEKVTPAQAADVVRACEQDARLDAYRRKVIEQGRDLVIGEGRQFAGWTHIQHWQAYGLERMSTLMPLAREGARQQ